MKNLIKMLIAVALTMSLAACESSTGTSTGDVKFGMEIPNSVDGNILFGTGGKTFTDETPKTVKMTYYSEGSPTATTTITYGLSEVSAGKYYTDDIIKLTPGNYKLSLFQVLNAADSVIYMTPKSGAPLAVSTITTPLDWGFAVASDDVTNVTMDVVKVLEEHNPADFGYVGNTFEVIDYNTFYIKILTLSAGWENATANLVVTNNDDQSIIKENTSLDSTLNKVIVSVCDNYKLSITKTGYIAQDSTFTETELQNLYNIPLVIKLVKE